MRIVIAILLCIAGIIHLLPLGGVLGAQRLSALYDVSVSDPNLTILLRHRAVLFGLLGALMILAAWRPALQPLAFAGGLISTLSFLAIALTTNGYNNAISRVMLADVVAIVALLAALLLYVLGRKTG